MSDYSEYRNTLTTVDPDAFIGNVAWYAVSTELSVPRAEMEIALKDNDLGSFLPRAACASDVFRRVCSGAQQKGIPTLNPGVFQNFMLRNPGNDDARIVRRVVREEVDANNLRLGYSETAELSFDRSSTAVSFTLLIDEPATREICQKIVSEYTTELTRLNHNAVRDVIKRVLVSIEATNIRYPSGGVYFVPFEYADTLGKLETVMAQFPDGLTFHTLPLVDTRKQRDLLKKAFEAESTDKVRTLINEISEIRRTGVGVTTNKYNSYLREVLETQEKMNKYESLLKSELNMGTSSFNILKEMVISLRDVIREDGRARNGRRS